ncbi:hypothetical protein Tco_1547673 [Tanacetum coccineum]
MSTSSRLRRNMEMEPDTENMTISEYLEYKAAKERQLWDDVRSRRSPTKYNEADVDSYHQNKRAKNMKQMGHDIVQDSIWEHDDDLEEDQEEDGDDEDTFDMWDITAEDVERIRKFFNVPDCYPTSLIHYTTIIYTKMLENKKKS